MLSLPKLLPKLETCELSWSYSIFRTLHFQSVMKSSSFLLRIIIANYWSAPLITPLFAVDICFFVWKYIQYQSWHYSVFFSRSAFLTSHSFWLHRVLWFQLTSLKSMNPVQISVLNPIHTYPIAYWIYPHGCLTGTPNPY